MMWGWESMHMGGWTGGWVFMTVFWVALIALVVWAVAALFPRGRGGGDVGGESPRDVLDRRYARGELDAETYRQMREDLRGGDGARR